MASIDAFAGRPIMLLLDSISGRIPDLNEKVGNLLVTLGDQSTLNFSGTIGVPIVEGKSAFRLFAYREQDDGFRQPRRLTVDLRHRFW
ncbi:MAG: hypothetical protein E2O59_09580 [Gammaproteobacteria bacterium]|nr:MAG: hypothetical protein E2O59_09580 [Gammaproteobacteria bacterium]